MAKPVILTIDDDPEVLPAISRDLRKQYGDRFKIVRANHCLYLLALKPKPNGWTGY